MLGDQGMLDLWLEMKAPLATICCLLWQHPWLLPAAVKLDNRHAILAVHQWFRHALVEGSELS